MNVHIKYLKAMPRSIINQNYVFPETMKIKNYIDIIGISDQQNVANTENHSIFYTLKKR